MHVEDIIIQKLLQKNKKNKIILFQPTEPDDDRQKLVVTRPDEHTILLQEVYEDTRNPITEKQAVQGLKKLLEQKKVEEVKAKKQDTIFDWVRLV